MRELYLSITGWLTSMATAVVGFITLSHIAVIVAICSGIFSMLASYYSIRKTKNN